MPPVSLLCHYLDDEQRRGFVESMAEVKVSQNEVIMRQGAPPGARHVGSLHAPSRAFPC